MAVAVSDDLARVRVTFLHFTVHFHLDQQYSCKPLDIVVIVQEMGEVISIGSMSKFSFENGMESA